MAKIKLTEGGFTLIPEGTYTFRVVEVDDDNYEDFGELIVKMKTENGLTHDERFKLMTADGEVNEGALRAWSYFAKTCLNNFRAEEIDTQDIVGCYITAEVTHREYEAKKGKHKGEMMKAVQLGTYGVATGFDSYDEEDAAEELDDLDDFLDD